MVDAIFAVSETKKQSLNNEKLLKELVDSGGVVALERVFSSHRFAYPPFYSLAWEFEPLADKYGLESVRVYPHFCQDKYFKQASPLENIYIDDEIKYGSNSNDALGDIFWKYARLIVRLKTEELQASKNHVTFTIDYTRPKKWYKSWLDKLRNYQYDRTEIVERDDPDVSFDGYCYYVIWFGRENAKNLKSVKYEVK